MRTDLDAIDRLIAANIRRHRLINQLTQAELAAALGISYQQLQKYERGMNRISASRLYCLAEVLELPISVFFERPIVKRGLCARIAIT